jgi:RNA polymerase sigma-70 factor, ECF subfamily
MNRYGVEVNMDADRILISRILDGDANSFSELATRYYPRILAFLLKMGVGRQDAEDMAQEVFIKVYNNLFQYSDRWKFSTWLFRIATNTFRDFRKDKKLRTETLSEQEEGRTCSSPEEHLEQLQQRQLIQSMLHTLNDDVKAVMVLHYLQELSFKEIGQIYGVSAEAVKMKIFRARSKLCKAYAKAVQGGDYCEM